MLPRMRDQCWLVHWSSHLRLAAIALQDWLVELLDLLLLLRRLLLVQSCELCLQVHWSRQILRGPRVLLIPLLARLWLTRPRLSRIVTCPRLGLWWALLLVLRVDLHNWLAARSHHFRPHSPTVGWYSFTVSSTHIVRDTWRMLFTLLCALLQALLLGHELDSVLGRLHRVLIERVLRHEGLLQRRKVLLCSVLLQQHLVECQLLVSQHVVLHPCLLSLTCIRLRGYRLPSLG